MSVILEFLAALRASAYRAWQDRRGNTDYDVAAIDAEDFRDWFDDVSANAIEEGARLDPEGVCLAAWRASNPHELDDIGWEIWWTLHGATVPPGHV